MLTTKIAGPIRQLGQDSRKTEVGVSLPEVTVVVLIVLVVSAVLLPKIVVVAATARLRASMTTLSGTFQGCRMLAVKQNRTMTSHFNVEPWGLVQYSKDATDSGPMTTKDP